MSILDEVAAERARPILFGDAMVRAILAGRKTQTRRLVKPQPPEDVGRIAVGRYSPTVVRRGMEEPGPEVFGAYAADDGAWAKPCPYGAPGDALWVREAWCLLPPRSMFFRADPPNTATGCWKPSIHMPRWASRLTLDVVSVRVERVQDISEADIAAEGIDAEAVHSLLGRHADRATITDASPAGLWRLAWCAINGAESWDANPWVWAIEFRRRP